MLVPHRVQVSRFEFTPTSDRGLCLNLINNHQSKLSQSLQVVGWAMTIWGLSKCPTVEQHCRCSSFPCRFYRYVILMPYILASYQKETIVRLPYDMIFNLCTPYSGQSTLYIILHFIFRSNRLFATISSTSDFGNH